MAIIDHGCTSGGSCSLTLCSYGAVASNPPETVAFSATFSFASKTVWGKPGHAVAQNEYAAVTGTLEVRSRAGFKCDSAHLISSPLYDSNGSPSSFATAAAKCDADPSCGALYDNKDDGVGFFSSRQSQNDATSCVVNGRNNLVGCGSGIGDVADAASCAPLTVELREVHCDDSCAWLCDDPQLFNEAEVVQKLSDEDGGVLCCKDGT